MLPLSPLLSLACLSRCVCAPPRRVALHHHLPPHPCVAAVAAAADAAAAAVAPPLSPDRAAAARRSATEGLREEIARRRRHRRRAASPPVRSCPAFLSRPRFSLDTGWRGCAPDDTWCVAASDLSHAVCVFLFCFVLFYYCDAMCRGAVLSTSAAVVFFFSWLGLGEDFVWFWSSCSRTTEKAKCKS